MRSALGFGEQEDAGKGTGCDATGLSCRECVVVLRPCRASAVTRDKSLDTNSQFLSVDLARQLLPGTFENALIFLLNHAVDLAHFDARFRNATTGAPTYPPAMLLKVVRFAYSQSIVRQRAIERVCQEHVTFMALCGMTAPHFTTIAHFASTLRDDIANVFCGGADGVQWPRPDRARDVRDRRRQAAEQRVQASEWDTRRVHAAGGEIGGRR